MRITNSMLIKDMLWNSNNNLVSMAQKQTELSTGKRIHRPSDDPVGITQVLKYKTDIRETEQYKKNVDDALSWLEVSEISLMSVKDILQRVRELTIQAANGTNTAGDTQKIKTEVEKLKDELIVVGNATNAGRYIFTGLETNKKLFKPDGSFNIDMTSARVAAKETPAYEVAIGEVMAVGTHPVDVFGALTNNSFFNGLISNSSAETGKATQSTFLATIDMGHDYTADTLDITVGGSTFNVDEGLLENTALNPLTKERFLDAMKLSFDGTHNLQDVADVYFNLNNQLVVQAKTPGAATTINTAAIVSAGVTPISNTTGTNGTGSTITGSGTVTNAAIAARTDIETLIVKLNGVDARITLDFSTINDATQLQTAINTQLNAAFGPVSPVTASVVDGGTIDFNVTGLNNGETNKIAVDYVVSNKSELITDMFELIDALNTKDDPTLQAKISAIDKHLEKVLTAAGEIGGRDNRLGFVKDRNEENGITFTGLLSKIQDVDMAEAIMYFKNLENIYRASLSVGSKVIQPSLVDFIN